MVSIHHDVALFIILSTILLVQAQNASSPEKDFRKRFSCPEESKISNCSCEDYSPLIQISCPRINSTVEVDVEDKVKTVLTCLDLEPYDFKSISNLAVGSTIMLVIKDCKLEKDQPLLETIKFLGIADVRSLKYANYWQSINYNAKYFEGLELLENLTLSRGVASINQDTFFGFQNLKRLTIELNNLKFHSGIFNELRNLTYLNLDDNKITDLEPGVFDSLEQLKELSLSYNKIKYFAPSLFSNLRRLKYLNLRYNGIESFDQSSFTSLTELSRLELAFNSFANLPTGLFAGNKKLKTLILMMNKNLTTLPDELLANLPELNTINLSYNAIKQLPQSLLRGSSAIVKLDLNHNKLQSLPEELLIDQGRLRMLNLDHNQLEELPDYLFENTRELQTLMLSNNHLKYLSDKLFAKLGSLEELHLENNQLQTIAQFAFSGTPKLKNLYMQNNRLAFHPYSFKHNEFSIAENDNTPFQYLVELQNLHLANNNITTIFQDWYMNNLKLTNLNLSFNKLSELTFVDLQFLSSISINLTHNEISRIILGDLNVKPNQIKVDLNNNPLNCNCNILKFVQLVQSSPDQGLQFSIDRLQCVEPMNLKGKTVNQLDTMDLLCDLESPSDCPTNCQCAMRLLDLTVVVNCSGQELTQIPELPIPSQLHKDFNALELHVENNLLTNLPSLDLTGYNEVTQLYASNNFIRTLLPQNIPSKVRLLDLSRNQLEAIDELTLDKLNRSNHLQTLRLSQNQWLCECPAAPFLLFVQQNPKLISDMSGVQCYSTGKSLDSITVNELCYENFTTKIVICFVIAIFGVMVGLISLLFFRYQTEVKVWLFTHNLFLSLITEEELDKDKLYDAFISYSHLDEDFITDELIPKLENEPMNFKTCWHVRDFMPGEMIMTQIVKSIESSRRTLIILSKNYLESSWAKHEFRQAHVQSMGDNRVRVIVVIYQDIGDIDDLDDELKAYLRTNTYVKWGDPWFWQKLRYAMPHPFKVKGIKSALSEIHLQQVKTSTPTAV